jgi:L-asparaginase II
MHLEGVSEIGNFALKLPEASPLTKPWLAKSKANHPCSGKHSAILRASRKHGWPEDTYLSQSHPYHEAYLRSLQHVLGSRWVPLRTAVDGCGLPTPSFHLSELAHLYEALSARRDEDWIWSAMTSHPEMVGGADRLDTEIMRLNNGAVVAKEGADGLLGLAFAVDGVSYGIAIKISHGHDPRASGAVAETLLRHYGFKAPTASAPHGQTLELSQDLRIV